MPDMFKHHPDGYIIIRRNDDVHIIPLDVFLSVEPDYHTPELSGFIGREYVPGVRHFLHTSDTAEPQPLIWPEGDGYIARLDDYLDALNGPGTQE